MARRNRTVRHGDASEQGLIFDALESRVMLATVVWDGEAGSTNWHTALNWSNNAVPTAADDVIIPEDAPSEVWISSTDAAARSLVVEGVLRLMRTLSMSGGATIDGELRLVSVGRLNLTGTADRSFDGTGVILLDSLSGSTDTITVLACVLTIGPQLTIRGGSGTLNKSPTNLGAIVNYGTISADVAGRTIEILIMDANGFVNHGRLESPGGVLRISTSGVGTIRLEETSQLVSVGGRLELAGVLDNTDRTLTLQSSDGVLSLKGSTILGGVVTATGDTGLDVLSSGTASRFNGVALDAPVTVQGGASLEFSNGLLLTRTIRFAQNTSNSGIYFAGGNQTLSGNGQIVFDSAPLQPHWITVFSSALTIGPDITIRGGGVGINSSQMTINYGTISADLPGGTISLNGLRNFGRLESPAGTLSLSGTVHFEPEGSWSSVGGTVLLRGVLVNTGRELLLNEDTGPLRVGASTSVPARITGGTITSVDGTGLFVTNSEATLLEGGVALNAPVLVRGAGALYIRGGLTLASVITLGDGATSGSMVFQISGSQLLSGNGEINFNFTGTSTPYFRADAATVTIGPEIVIRGGKAALEAINNGRIIHTGTVVADRPGLTLQIRSTSSQGWINRGTLRSDGGTLELFTSGLGTLAVESGTALINDAGLISLRASMTNVGHVLELSGAAGLIQMDSGKIVGGTIAGMGSASITVSGNFELDGITLSAPMLVAGVGILNIRNHLVLHSTLTLGADEVVGAMNFLAPAASTLSGSGHVAFNSTSTSFTNQVSTSAGVSLTIEPGITVRGGNGRVLGTAGLTTRGEIVADVPGRTITLATGSGAAAISNVGTLRVMGGTISIGTSTTTWTSMGLIVLVQGGLNLGGSFTQAGAGVIQRSGGQVNIVGTVSGDLMLTDDTGIWNLAGGTISFGVITATGSGGFELSASSTLDGVTLNVPLVVAGSPMRVLTVRNGLIANADMLLGTADGQTGQVRFTNTSQQILGGTGSLVFHPDSVEPSSISVSGGVQLTFGPGFQIRGGNGTISSQFSSSAVTNRGSIVVGLAERTLSVQTAAAGFINEGIIAVEQGGTLTVSAAFTNAGTLRLGHSSLVSIGGSFQQIAGALLDIGIAGATNSLMGRLVATGSAALGGAITLAYENGFAASRGEEFRFISSSGTTGAFTTTNSPAAPAANLKAPVLSDALGVRLIVTHIADWNNDLVVNVPDIFSFLTSWFNGQGDFDGQNGNQVTDIFAFLTAWFAA